MVSFFFLLQLQISFLDLRVTRFFLGVFSDQEPVHSNHLASKTKIRISNEMSGKKTEGDKGVDKKMTLSDIPLGVCCNCGVKQQKIATGGFWINGLPEKWACYKCKYEVPIRSYPFACEWCTSSNVTWAQFHTYECHRCKKFGIGQAAR